MKLNNLPSLQANANTERNRAQLTKSLGELSSGSRIGDASGDAAGLAVSEGLRSQIRSFNVAERNAFDGMAMAQTADGSLGEVGDVLGRMRELAMQSSNGALSNDQRGFIETEFAELQSQLNQIQEDAEFNGTALLAPSSSTVEIQVGLDESTADRIDLDFGVGDLSGVVTASTDVGSESGALNALGRIDQALQTVSDSRSGLGAGINRLSSAAENISAQKLNLVEAKSRIGDADVAQSASNAAMRSVRAQMGLAVQAQANQLSKNAFSLIN